MSNMLSDGERVEKDFKKLIQIVSNIQNEDLKKSIDKMLSDPEFQALFCSCPASSQDSYGGACIGGLMQYSIKVTSILKKLSEATVNLNIDDIIVAGLFHHLGKIGYPNKPVYESLNSDWHNKKGIHYEINSAYFGSGINHNITTFWWLNKFGVNISPEAHESIAAMNTKPGSSSDEYSHNQLTILLTAATRLAWQSLSKKST